MANIQAWALLLIVIATGGYAGMAGAQSPPPPTSSSSSSCSASLVSLMPCLAYLQGGPNTTPTQGCCTALTSVVNTNAACLCQLFTSTNNSMGISINQTRALALPGACKITTPSLSKCKSAAVSTPPAASPSSPTPVVGNSTPTAAKSGSHEGPTASANAGSMMGVSMFIHVVGIMGSIAYLISASSIM